jgi:hypothetical protein
MQTKVNSVILPYTGQSPWRQYVRQNPAEYSQVSGLWTWKSILAREIEPPNNSDKYFPRNFTESNTGSKLTKST